jgi:adenylate cyclase
MIRRWVRGLGAVPGEPPDQRTLRVAMVTACLAGLGLTVSLSVLSTVARDVVMFRVNGSAALFLGLWLAWFARHRRFERLVYGVAVGATLAACVATYLMGGVTRAGGALQMAVLGPVLVALCLPRRQAVIMFGAFVASIGATYALLQRPGLAPPDPRERLNDLSQVINITVISAFIVFLMTYLSDKRRQAQLAFAAEHRRSESLLLNVLPSSIAERLKEKPAVIADSFDAVSILFADIVGFTPLSASLTPAQLVAILNDLFSRFDALCDRHGLEKIKTIGDAYLVVAGLPAPRFDHALAIADMALDMQAELRAFCQEAGLALELRIGINSGPVVAGVIGRKKFIYDLWGDAVNVASRMESHGRPGTIQVAPPAEALLRDHFRLTSLGRQLIKGKGELETWLLQGRKTGPTPATQRSES